MTPADASAGSTPSHRRVRHADGLFVRRTRGALLVLGRGEDPLVLRDISIDLWDALDEGRSVADVADLASEGMGVTSERAIEDLVPFVERLLAEGLLEDCTSLT